MASSWRRHQILDNAMSVHHLGAVLTEEARAEAEGQIG